MAINVARASSASWSNALVANMVIVYSVGILALPQAHPLSRASFFASHKTRNDHDSKVELL
jgi:hypothetical protein